MLGATSSHRARSPNEIAGIAMKGAGNRRIQSEVVARTAAIVNVGCVFGLRLNKATTGLTGIKIHPNPLPTLRDTFDSNLQLIRTFPESSVYRQSLEVLLSHKRTILQNALDKEGPGDVGIARVESELGDGQQIEEVLMAAEDELSLTQKMLEWNVWEALDEKPLAGQWEYFGTETRS